MLSRNVFIAAGVGLLALASATDVLWLPLGDSITFGCVGPTIQDCHPNGGGYRIPLAYALSQPFGSAWPGEAGYNVSTMGTLTTGPSYVPAQWTRHEGHPGWTIPAIDQLLDQSLATSPSKKPDLITIHLGTNDCDGGVAPTDMVTRMDSLLAHIFAKTPTSQVFLASVIRADDSAASSACTVAFNLFLPNITTTWLAKGMKLTLVPMANQTGLCGNVRENLCGAHQIHPTTAGYPLMASAFALSIFENFQL